MPRDTKIKIKHSDGKFHEVVPGKSPKVIEQERQQRSRPIIDVSKLPDPKEIERR